ncbi:Diacylglycerol kinase family enzyme [Rheinheimera pacifica]|uniref:Diacylglycerol kinase family enzyme n=1 Tax=Rheinheimera pacifica TaxID=173990 RepID=A0A1H6K5T7_9GAMM|nr:diacylglycerol kinase family protein [Rheinheimera pacifica]SEH66836.1 Diacylglycerol kinase family enzyme [Rheinheimera pacifica]
MIIALYYVLLALLLAVASWLAPYLLLQLVLAWAALSFLVVSSAYWLNTATVFRKRVNGSLPWYSRWLFIPFLFSANLYNLQARRRDKVAPMQRVSGGLYLGARLTAADMAQLRDEQITAVLDVTAEFAALDELSQSDDISYLNIPVLDHASPSHTQLQQAVNWLQRQRADGRKVLVHCALGRGRSVLVLAAYLLSRHNSRSAEKAVALIRQVRQTARLNKHQLAALRQFTNSYTEQGQQPVWLIANPAAGGGKWADAEAEVVDLLSPFMRLSLHVSSEDCTARQLAQQAKQTGCTMIIACGGDGTVTEVASELVGTEIRLGIIPLGTTNALSHALWGISSKLMPLRSACLNIIEGQSRAIDTARCNDKLMLLLAGVGFEQQMIEAADRSSKDQLGQLAYLNGLWQAVQANHIQQLLVQFDEQPEQELDTASLVIANAAPLTTLLAQGHGAPDLTDGKLDITWLTADNNTDNNAVFGLAELALAGLTNISLNAVSQHCSARRVQIRRQDGQQLQYVIDGELYSDSALDISVVPASLQVMLADSADSQQGTV